jgi:hypothetical protein
MRELRVVEVTLASVARVSAATGEPMDGGSELTAAGYVVADRQSVLAAKFTGRLAKLNVPKRTSSKTTSSLSSTTANDASRRPGDVASRGRCSV